jgi:methyl-accepting chemotaxis protein
MESSMQKGMEFMKLQGKMVCYFLVVVAVCAIGFGLIIYDSLKTKTDIGNVYTEELPRLLMVVEINEYCLEQAADIRSYLFNHDEQMITKYKKASNNTLSIARELLAQTSTPERRKLIEEVITYATKYASIIDNNVVPLIKAGKIDEATAYNAEAVQVYNKMMPAVESLEHEYINTTKRSLVSSIDSADNTLTVSGVMAVISIILGVFIALWSARGIAGKVAHLAELAKGVAAGDLTRSYHGEIGKDEMGDLASSLNTMVANLKEIVKMIGAQAQNVTASSEALTASADHSAQATQQVAASVIEVATSTNQQLELIKTATNGVENMVAELEEVASNVSMIAGKTAQTAEMASNGGQSATRAINQMYEVEKTVSESAKVVAHLGERSKEIGQIVDTISGIASQTNLLALNAAIEAARAGEQGRGFAVVAEEVRKLAEQSQEASKRIAELIGEIQLETDHAVAAMQNGTREVKLGAEVVNETGMSFKEIIDLVNHVSGQMNSIAHVVQSVAQESERVMSSVQYINELSVSTSGEIQTVSATTEEQSASMQEIAASSQSLSNLAQDMQVTVERFKI